MKKTPKWIKEEMRNTKLFLIFMYGLIIFYAGIIIYLASEGALK